MVQQGTPEQYFGTGTQRIVMGEPVELVQPLQAKIVEPVQVQYPQAQATTDYTPLIIGVVGVCFLGAVCFLAFLAWSWKR